MVQWSVKGRGSGVRQVGGENVELRVGGCWNFDIEDHTTTEAYTSKRGKSVSTYPASPTPTTPTTKNQ